MTLLNITYRGVCDLYYLPAKHVFLLRISTTVVLPVGVVTLKTIRTSTSALTSPVHGKPIKNPEIQINNLTFMLLVTVISASLSSNFLIF